MRKKRKSGLIVFLLLIAVAMFAYFTNPTENMHRKAASEKINIAVAKTLDKYGLSDSALGALGTKMTKPFIAVLVEQHVSSKNYYLFSTTQVNLNGKSQIIGVGAFNKVFISNKVDEVLEREINNYINEKIKDIKIPEINLDDLLKDLEIEGLSL